MRILIQMTVINILVVVNCSLFVQINLCNFYQQADIINNSDTSTFL